MEKTGPKVTCLPAVFFAEENSSCFTLTARGGGGGVSFRCCSTQRASRNGGSPWTTEGSCTSKIPWYCVSVSHATWKTHVDEPRVTGPASPLCVPAAGRLRTGRGVHRVQREQLHRATGPPPERAGQPLAVRHHHSDARQEVPVRLRDRRGPERLGGRVPERHRPTDAASGVRR